jgi:DNA-binding transcriptional MerR regulator
MLPYEGGDMRMQSRQYERQHAADVLTVGQLAEQTGISAKTIRYYESIGLLPQPPRGANRYRRYSMADVNRVHLLRRIRYLGVPLTLAQPLLAGASDARCVDVQRHVLALVEKRLRAIDQEIAELKQLRSDVAGYQRRLAACYAESGDTNEQFSECSDMSCIALPSEHEGVSNDECVQRAL